MSDTDRDPARVGPTIAELIELWAQTKDPAVAERVAALGQTHETAAGKALRGQTKVKQPQWLAALREGELVDRGAVLASLAGATSAQVAQRIEAMAEYGDDPRVADALHELIRTVPWTSTGARKVWTRCFATLAEIGDPRTIEVARAFDPSKLGAWSEAAGGFMRERLDKLAAKLEAGPRPRALTEAERDRVAGLAGPGEVGPRPQGRAEATVIELFVQAMVSPDDLDVRSVLADALTELGDPRGELIRVQVAREAAPSDRALARRENQLLTEHRARLLGPLEPVVFKQSLVWRRGYVDACVIDPAKHADLVAAAIAQPQVASIRRLRALPDVVLDPRLINLREAEVLNPTGRAQAQQMIDTFEDGPRERDLPGPPLGAAVRILRCDRVLPWTGLELRLEPGDDELLDDCTTLPALERLALYGEHETLVAAIPRALTRQVRHLHWVRPELGRLPELVRPALTRLERLTRLSYGLVPQWDPSWGGSVTLTRDGGALHGALVVTLPGDPSVPQLGRVLDAIGLGIAATRGHGLASLTVTSTKRIRAPQVVEQFTMTVRANVDAPERVTWALA